MRIGTFILSVVGAALLAACGPSGTYYEKTPEQVAAALKKAYLPSHVLGNGFKRSRVTQPDPNTVVTALIGANGKEAMHIVTTITPEGTGSRVATEVKVPEDLYERAAGQAMVPEAHLVALMDGLANEHVAAAIEGRPFDMMFAANPMAKGMLRNNPELSAQIEQTNASAAEWSRIEQDMKASSRKSGWADDSSEPAFGMPMDDARGSQ